MLPMDTTSPLLVRHVSKYFNERPVLQDINLALVPGEIYGLVGINGVGKTTLIKIILQLLTQCSGEVFFFGHTAKEPKNRKFLAYVPEKFSPSPLLKGSEFLSLAVSYHLQSLDKQQVEEKADILGLDYRVLSQRIGHYSKGMAQKLGLLAAFLVNAPLLVLDEPMSGLDPGARIRLKTLLKQHVAQGNSVFFSSHILADIEEICDRMAIMHESRLVYEGTPFAFLQEQNVPQLEQAFLKVIG